MGLELHVADLKPTYLCCTIYGILLHFFGHVRILNHCLTLGHLCSFFSVSLRFPSVAFLTMECAFDSVPCTHVGQLRPRQNTFQAFPKTKPKHTRIKSPVKQFVVFVVPTLKQKTTTTTKRRRTEEREKEKCWIRGDYTVFLLAGAERKWVIMGVRTTPRIPQNQSHPLTGQDEHDYYKARASVENSSNLVLKEKPQDGRKARSLVFKSKRASKERPEGWL